MLSNALAPSSGHRDKWLQVERAKKCLDFAATIYILHVGMVWLVSGLPARLAW